MKLREFIALVGEDRALKALSSFSVKRNPDVENFIRTNAVAYEKSDNASHDDLMMRDFIDFAIEYVMAAKQYVGGRFLLIDCVDEARFHKDQQNRGFEPAYHVPRVMLEFLPVL